MTKIIESFAGNTQEVEKLRKQISAALEAGPVKVHLWQPGIMYQQNNDWFTVIDFINEWKDQQVIFYSNLIPLRRTECEFHYTNDMFISDCKLYEKNDLCKSLLKKLRPVENKRKYHWEFLFGQHRPLKNQLYEKLLNHSVSNKTLHVYFGKDPSKGIWSHGYIPRTHTAETIDGDENAFVNPVRHSDLIDVEIYNQTYYSAVIETVIHNDFAMFSEKEAKPIMARRPFVILGARHQLRAFRSLGFETFSSVIDESYDDIEDCYERFNAVLDAMEKLCEMDPLEVYKKLHSVIEHNKKHFLENHWTKV